MAKQKEVKKIRPSEAILSLEEFNNRVLMLINIAKSLIGSGKIDKDFSPILDERVRAVDEFYNTED